MSWLDDWIDMAGEDESNSLLMESGSDVDYSEIKAGLSDVLADDGDHNRFDKYMVQDAPNDPIKPSYDGYTTGNGYTNDDNNTDEPKSLSAKGEVGDEKNMFGQATDFIEKNKRTTDMVGGLIGAAYNSSQKKKEDAKAYERMLEKRAYDEKIQKEKEDRADARRGGGGGGSSAMEMLAAKDALEQAKNARFSASVTGLRPQGLINKGRKLTYVGGKPVYTDSGSLA